MFNQVDYLGDGMPVLTAPESPTHRVGDTSFTSLATPSRGTSRTSVWLLELAAGARPTTHSITEEEIFGDPQPIASH